MFAHMQSVCTRGTGPICIGGLITSIARALGLHNELSTLQPIDTPSLDMDVGRNMRLVKARQDDMYFLMAKKHAVRSVILPCFTHTDVQNKNNWIYDLTAPEPGHPTPTDIHVQDNRVVRLMMSMIRWSMMHPIFMNLLHMHTLHLVLLTLLQVHLSDTSSERNMTMLLLGSNLMMFFARCDTVMI